jgi:hypothetical protein
MCGDIRYECAADPIAMGNCHCRDCQKATGSAFAAAVLVPTSAVNITGEVKYHEVTGDSGRIVRRGFCPNCGVRLFGKATASPEIISIMAGSLELVSAASGHLYSERAVLGLYESGSAQVPRLAPELVRGSPDFGGENFFRLATFD